MIRMESRWLIIDVELLILSNGKIVTTNLWNSPIVHRVPMVIQPGLLMNPESNGGLDTAPTPSELLLSAILVHALPLHFECMRDAKNSQKKIKLDLRGSNQ